MNDGRRAYVAVLVLLEEEEIDDLKNSERVQNEHDNKPSLLMIPCRTPEREPFPDK
jgi:hypothetical protein